VRPIKFRGKSVTTGEWLYGSLINNAFILSSDGSPIFYILDNKKMEYDCFEAIGEQLDEFEVMAESVGQYTGFKDGNGREIYEGDVINSIFHWMHYIAFEDGKFVYIPANKVQQINWSHSPSSSLDLKLWEVVGNKCDDPELLEVQT